MYRLLVALTFALFASACSPKEEAAVPDAVADDIDLIVRCGTLVDGLSDTSVTDRAIVIRNQRISEILPGDDASFSNVDVLDLSNHTCLPGLIDMHVHVDGYPEDADDYNIYLQRTPEETKRIAAELGEVILRAGFTTVRNVGTYKAWVARDLRDQIEAGEVLGPRLRVAGPYLTIPHGGGDMYFPGVNESEIPAYYRMGVARGAEEFRDRAQANVDGGADFIKIIASGAVFGHGGVPGAPEMTFEEIAAVVEVARAAGIKVTAHAHSAESIKDAILAGVDSIEHASLGDDESIALAVKHDIAFSMDVYNGTFTEEMGGILGYAEEFMRKNEETTEAQRVVFRKALAAGVTLMFGTDLGVLPHDMGARQFEEMLKQGMEPMHAIKSATSIAADHMELGGDVGAVAPGRYGDLIAVRGNPLKDISVLQNVEVVIKGGDIIKDDSQGNFADTVYHTGKIYTVNPQQPWAQAVAVTAGKISFVGSDDRARALIGPNTKTIDLRGKMMLPGFQDAHVHAISGGLQETSCNLGVASDLAAYRSIISQCAANDPDSAWITGGGWSMDVFGPGAKTDKTIIDELVSDRPVYLDSADGHTGWANSKALEIAGITKDTPDPSDGIIDRDAESGEPIGSLQEGAMALMQPHIPQPTQARRTEALEYTRDLMHSVGITSIQSGYTAEEDLRVYEELDNAGKLNLRVVASLRWNNNDTEEQLPSLVELRQRYLKGNIRPTSVKIFIDGVMENYTAVMLEPYLVESGTRGIPMIDPEFLPEAVSQIAAAGFQVHFHALGDGAVRMALDSIEESNRRNGDQDLRHHLVHLQVIHPDDMPRFGELGAVANFQMQWAMADPYITELTLPFISEETARWIYPIRSVIDAGGKIAMGSDWTVSTVDPLPQIETAVTRIEAIDHATEVLNPEQRITLAEALEGFTRGSAFVNHQDDTTGSIEVGKLADLIVLDKNLFDLEPHEISDAKVLLTLFEGQPVYGSLN